MANEQRSFGSRLRRWAMISLALVVVLFCIYTWFTLTWSYSTGERAGYVQKFSSRGLLVKTWEGELAMVSMPGTTPEKFYFSCRDNIVADSINASLGSRVVLKYEQHIGVPTDIFGETEYFVVGVRRIE